MAANKIQVGYIEAQDGAQFQVDAGTASAPGLCFDDSAATGLYSPGTGQIAWSTSGKQTALRILADGKVGVDCSPTVALEVNGTIKASAIDAPIEGTLDDWIVHAGDSDTKIGFSANDTFQVHTGGSARLEVTNSTTSIHEATDKVIRFFGSIGEIGSVTGFQATNTANSALTSFGIRATDIRFATGSAERLRIKSSGQVLLGNDFVNTGHANGDELTLSSSGNTGLTIRSGTSDAGNIYFADGTSGDDLIRGYISYGHNVNGLYFATDTSTRMFISSTGRVGINETSPESLLHIDGVSNDPYIYLQRSGAGDAALDIGGIFFKNDTKLSALIKCRTIDRTNAELIFETMNNDSRSEKLRIKDDGKLMTQAAGFIYTASSAGSLTLAGGNTNLGGKIVLTGGNGTGDITFHAQQSTSTPTQRMVIKNDGKIGINDTTPSRIMSINGSINFASGSRIESYSSSGNLIIQGGSTYPGGHIRMWGGSGDDMLTLNTSGAGTSSVERLRISAAGMTGINQGSSYNPLTSLDVRHPNGTAGNATIQYLLTVCAQRNSARGLEIGTGHPTSGNQNDAAVYYNAKDTESSSYHCQHVWQLGGTNRMVLGYTGGGARLGVGTNTPNGRNGSIDITCDDTTTWSPHADQRGEASLTLRNNSSNTNTFTALHFFNGGGTGTDVTLAAVRKANFEADFHLMRRINNAGSGDDWRTSVTSRGLGTGPKVIIWAEGTGDNNGDQQCGNHIFESQQMPGFNQYVYWNFKIGSASYSRAGSLRYHCTWSTGHASGTGYQIGTILWTNNQSNSTCYVREHLIYRRRYAGGHYYGWTSNPELEVFDSNNTGQNASIIFRCQGHGSHNSNSYNMSTVVHLHIEHMSVAQNSITPRLERFGSTSVSGTGNLVDGARRGYCTFSDTQPTAGNADF